jgi:peptidyl-prolyl cis-trans isomerase B (cyclophilin B)
MSNPQVELHIAGKGVILIELDAEKAPLSTENFLHYVNKGHYDNTIFHRVIPGFMIQGGGFQPGAHAAALHHEAWNDAVKNGLVVMALFYIGQKVGDGLGGFVGI